jgi:hypothetical protein
MEFSSESYDKSKIRGFSQEIPSHSFSRTRTICQTPFKELTAGLQQLTSSLNIKKA